MKRFIPFIPLLALGVLLFSTLNPAQARVDETVTLSEGQKAIIVPNGCNLSVLKNRPALVKVKCAPVAPPIVGEFLAQARPDVKKTLNPGQTLKVISNNCNLHINKQKPAKVVVVCQPKTTTVEVGDNGFSFSPQQVNIKVGDKVQWDWVSSNHTVTSGTAPTADGTFCSPNDTTCGTANPSNTGAMYEHQFNSAGTFQYFCKIHGAAMSGTVVVSP